MRETFRGTRTLRYIWNEQRGLCTVCNTPNYADYRMALAPLRPLVLGGQRVPKTAYYFTRVAMTRFTASIFRIEAASP